MALRAGREPRVRRGRQRAAGDSAQPARGARVRGRRAQGAAAAWACAARDVFVIHSLYGEPAQSANDKLVRLLFFIGALKDAAAARVTAVVPYLAYARKDRKTKSRRPGHDALRREPVRGRRHRLRRHARRAQSRGVRECVPLPHREPRGDALFVAHFAPLLADAEVAVVSPDAGGIKRAEQFRTRLAAALGRPVGAAFAEKYRSGGVRQRRGAGGRRRRQDRRSSSTT